MADSFRLIHLRDELTRFLRIYLKDPVGTLRSPLYLSWPSILSLLAASAMLSGAVVGLLNHSFLDFATGLLLFPVTCVVITAVFTFFIYYYFSFFHSTFLEFRRLYSVVVLAVIPYFVFHSVSGYLSAIDLVGFAIAALLLIVGLVEQFSLDRRTCVRLVGALGLGFFIMWSVSQYRMVKREEAERSAQPRSLDELQREVKSEIK
jgi:hypothetical protein